MLHLNNLHRCAARRLAVLGVVVLPLTGQDTSVSNVVITSDAPLAVGAYVARLPVFFPPVPPVMGTAIEATDAVDFRYLAPLALTAHVGEWYYPTLSTLLAEHRLTPALTERLAGYIRARDAAEKELLELVRQRDERSEPGRGSGHAADGEAHTARLEALEREAERLRREFMTAGADWNAFRRVTLARRMKREKEPREKMLIAQILLAAACYRHDLTPLQRALLLEAAIETGAADLGPYTAPFVTTDRRTMMFSPGAVRINVPREPKETLAAELAQFERLQAKLRRELVEAVTTFDLEVGTRAEQRWRTRVATQARDLVDFEQQAEALRQAFLIHGVNGWPAPAVEWPEDFRSRVERCRRKRLALAAERGAAAQEVRVEMLVYRPGADGKHLNVKSTLLQLPTSPGTSYYINYVGIHGVPEQGRSGMEVMQRMRESIGRVERSQRERLAALEIEETALGAEAVRIMRVEGTMTAQQALAVVGRALAQSAADRHYALYRYAVLEPGLTPAQRRLMLAMAMRQLNLALPGGEFQPREQ